MSPLKGLALWMRYNFDMVNNRRLHPSINQWPIIQFEALINDQSSALDRILQQWQDQGFKLNRQDNAPLICRAPEQKPNQLESLPREWVELAQTFHSALQTSRTLGDVPVAIIDAVEKWLEHTPDLTHKLLAQEALRREHLGTALAAERAKPRWRKLLSRRTQ